MTAIRPWRLLIACLIWGSGAHAQVPLPVTDFRAGPDSGAYAFASSTPADLAVLLDPQRPRPPQTIVGYLSLPKGEGPWPMVLLMHGSGGVYPELRGFWTERLAALGIGTFVIDMFGPRGVRSTVEDQSRVPLAGDLADGFAALALLATHPRIDARRIAVMGFSRGGTDAWRLAVTRLDEAVLPDGPRFAAHIPMYAGGCAGLASLAPGPGVFGPAPLLFVHGLDDDYAYAADCREFAARIAAAGTPAEFVGIAGARHKFDAEDSRRYYLSRAVKLKQGCPFETDIAGLVPIDRRSGERLTWAVARPRERDECLTHGASVEGDSKAREQAAQAVSGFLTRVFRLDRPGG